jgi:copper transport protein
MFLAVVALAARGVLARFFSLVAILGTGLALALSGHASAAEPQWLTRPSVVLHAGAIAFWVGALIPLASALRSDAPNVSAALGRFSTAIPFLIAALIVAGVSLAAIQVQKPAALLETDYGRVFLVKLGLLAALFSLAAINRWRLTRPVMRQDKIATQSMVRSIAAETTIVILIFTVVATWRFTPPPRALAIAAAEPAYVHIHTAKAMADLTVTPGRTGPVAATMVIASGDFGPLEAKEVALVLSNPSAGIEPIRRTAQQAENGSWQVDDLVIPAPGAWTVRVYLLITDFEMARLEGEISIWP